MVAITAGYFLLRFGKPLLMPLALALLFALAVYPAFDWCKRKGLKEVPAIVVSIFFVFLIVAAVIALIIIQLTNLVQDAPTYAEQLQKHITNIQEFVERNFNVNAQEQVDYINQLTERALTQIPNFILTVLNSTFTIVFYTVLVAVYTALFLRYRDNFKNFLVRVAPRVGPVKMKQFFVQTNEVIQNYIGGLFLVMLLLAVLNSLVLLIIGIDFPFFFGVLAAVLTIIPYIGVFIGSTLPILFALITKDSLFYPIAILIAFDIIQFLEGNFITPNIMGQKVNLSPLSIIVGLFIGGLLWGPVGMIVSVPYLAITKIVFSNSRELQPYAKLITGYTSPQKEGWLTRSIRKVKNVVTRKAG